MRRVWARMQDFPHIFEVAHARGELHKYELSGTRIETDTGANPLVQKVLDDVCDVPMDELHTFATSGLLTMDRFLLSKSACFACRTNIWIDRCVATTHLSKHEMHVDRLAPGRCAYGRNQKPICHIVIGT